MIVQVKFADNGLLISNALIKDLEVDTSISNIYPKAKLSLSGFDITLSNEIRIGRELIITFAENDDYIYRLPMKIIAFNKLPASLPTAEGFQIDLIHSFYFEKSLDSRAYGSGSTPVSSIISSLINEHYLNYFSGTSFIDSTDVGAVRYRIKESLSEFLPRILKYGHYKKFPIYLYTGIDNVLTLSSFYHFLSNEISKDFFSIKKQTLEMVENQRVNSYLMNSFKYVSNPKDSHSSIMSVITTDNFVHYAPSEPSLIFKGPELYSEQDDVTPGKVMFRNWNLSPSDALAISARESIEHTMKSIYSVVNIVGLHPTDIKLGDKVKISLHQEPDSEERIVGDGAYIIYRLKYIMAPGNIHTKIYLTTAN